MSRVLSRDSLMGSSSAGSAPTNKNGMEALSVLIIDDNIHMRKLLRALLSAFGIKEMFEAADGQSGYDLLREIEPDFVLADYNMKPVNGIAFVRMVRRSCPPPLSWVPIIMITAHTELGRIQAARDAGITEALCKPVTPRSLYDRIIEIIERPRRIVKTSEFVGPDRRRRRDASQYEGPRRRSADRGSEIEVI